MRRLTRVVVAALVLGTAGGAFAAELDDGPRWACWYAPQQLSARCLLASAPQAVQAERVVLAEQAYDRRLPELVKTIWGQPQALAGRQISIPLWSEPTDMEFAAMLVRSVMCGVRAACAAAFDPNHDGLGELRAAAGAFDREAYDAVEFVATQGERASRRAVVVD